MKIESVHLPFAAECVKAVAADRRFGRSDKQMRVVSGKKHRARVRRELPVLRIRVAREFLRSENDAFEHLVRGLEITVVVDFIEQRRSAGRKDVEPVHRHIFARRELAAHEKAPSVRRDRHHALCQSAAGEFQS